MKIHYRRKENEIEIVRCFGNDPKVVLPDQIDGYPVTKVAAYTFSERKRVEEIDVLSWQSEESFLENGQEPLLAGERVEEIVFPNAVREIGNYIFYGCKQLQRLEFSDSLLQIGSGAFTLCGKLRQLTVHLQKGEQSCVKEILGEQWQRMDVIFWKEGQKIPLVFPEHYEEAVENTPARILYTQHHGTGNNYRQCFYNREMDYRKYDDLFSLAIAQDKKSVLCELIFSRLESGYELAKRNEEMYEAYVKEHVEEVAGYLVEQEKLDWLKLISKRGLWKEEAMDAVIQKAASEGHTEIAGFLMNEKQGLFPEKTESGREKRKKRFAL